MSKDQEELMRLIKENNKAGIIFVGEEYANPRDWFAINATEEDIKCNRKYDPKQLEHFFQFKKPGNFSAAYPCPIDTREEARYRYADKMLAARGINDK